MCPKLVFQRQRWSNTWIWKYLYLCFLSKVLLANLHPNKLICLVVLNFGMSITKLSRVLFGTSTVYMLQKCVSLSMKS